MSGTRTKFGSHELDTDGAILRRAGEPCVLQYQPMRPLALLIERHGQVVTREEIREQLWSNTVVEYDQGINFAIRHPDRAGTRCPDGSDRPAARLPLRWRCRAGNSGAGSTVTQALRLLRVD